MADLVGTGWVDTGAGPGSRGLTSRPKQVASAGWADWSGSVWRPVPPDRQPVRARGRVQVTVRMNRCRLSGSVAAGARPIVTPLRPKAAASGLERAGERSVLSGNPLRSHMGQGVPSGSASPVPEPASTFASDAAGAAPVPPPSCAASKEAHLEAMVGDGSRRRLAALRDNVSRRSAALRKTE